MATKYLFVVLLFASCVSQKKVNRWLNEHPTEAAGYCADKFPVDTVAQVIYDSVDVAAYEAAYWEMAKYADSLFNNLDSTQQNFKPTPEQPCPPKMNIDSLRKVVDTEIRKRLIPCKDSIKTIIRTVVDRAREKQLEGKLSEKDAVITARDKRVTELEEKIKAREKWIWMFWGLVVLIGAAVFLRLKKIV